MHHTWFIGSPLVSPTQLYTQPTRGRPCQADAGLLQAGYRKLLSSIVEGLPKHLNFWAKKPVQSLRNPGRLCRQPAALLQGHRLSEFLAAIPKHTAVLLYMPRSTGTFLVVPIQGTRFPLMRQARRPGFLHSISSLTCETIPPSGGPKKCSRILNKSSAPEAEEISRDHGSV